MYITGQRDQSMPGRRAFESQEVSTDLEEQRKVQGEKGKGGRQGEREEAVKSRLGLFSTLASIWPHSMILDRLAVPKRREEPLLSQIRRRLKSLPFSLCCLTTIFLTKEISKSMPPSCQERARSRLNFDLGSLAGVSSSGYSSRKKKNVLSSSWPPTANGPSSLRLRLTDTVRMV